MSRTNDLRKFVKARLNTVCPNVYYETANNEKMYPHIVFDFGSINTGDLSRADFYMDIDIWDKGDSAVLIEDLADQVEDLFHRQNLPQETILPSHSLRRLCG